MNKDCLLKIAQLAHQAWLDDAPKRVSKVKPHFDNCNLIKLVHRNLGPQYIIEEHWFFRFGWARMKNGGMIDTRTMYYPRPPVKRGCDN